MKYIAVLDCNNFFVSCERLFRPDLRRQPVVVLSSNDGCVVARSQEVKDIGIAMGVPVFQIKDIIKDKGITTFSSNFTLYRDISARFMTVLKQQIEVVEQYSIDEAFFELEAESESDLYDQLLSIKALIEQSVGIPVSLGAAASKTQAKYINSVAKKSASGVAVGGVGWWSKMSSTIELRDIWGVGRRLQVQYNQAGIVTVADLCALSASLVGQQFGVVGVRLQAELRGQAQYKVSNVTEAPKSIMSTKSFGETVRSKVVLKDALAFHVNTVAAELRAKGLVVSYVSVMMRPSRFSDYVLYQGSESLVLETATNSSGEILRQVFAAVDRLFQSDIPYKKAGIVASGLLPQDMVPVSLWSPDVQSDHDGIDEVIDQLQSSYGMKALQRGRQVQNPVWQARSLHVSPSYTTRWSDIKKVTA